MERKNDIPLYGEEIVIEGKSEREVIVELRERLNVLEGEARKKKEENTSLQAELIEERRHSDKLDKMMWELFWMKDKVEKESDRKEKRITDLEKKVASLEKELIKEKVQVVGLEKELTQEQTWWNSWLTDSNHSISQEALLSEDISDAFFKTIKKAEKANIYNLENIFTQKYIGASKDWDNNLLEAKQGLIKVLQELKEKYKKN